MTNEEARAYARGYMSAAGSIAETIKEFDQQTLEKDVHQFLAKLLKEIDRLKVTASFAVQAYAPNSKDSEFNESSE